MYPNLRRTNLRYRGPVESEKFNHFYNNLSDQIQQIKTYQGLQAIELKTARQHATLRTYNRMDILVAKPDFDSAFFGVLVTYPTDRIEVPRFDTIETIGVLRNTYEYDPPLVYNDLFSFPKVAILDKMFANYHGFTLTDDDLPIEAKIYQVHDRMEAQQEEMIASE